MQKKKLLETSKIMMMICALMLIFGAVAAVSDGVEAAGNPYNTVSVTFERGLPEGIEIKGLPEKREDMVFEGEKLVLPTLTCTDSGYVFKYWTLVKADNTTEGEYAGGEKYSPPAYAITFRAVWAVKVTFDKNLDDVDETVTVPKDDEVLYGENYKIDPAKAAFTATNYEFLGWSTEAKKDSAEPEYKYTDANNVIKADAPIKLYAIWKAKFLRVTYHANTGSDATDSAVTVPVDTTKYMGEGDGLIATLMGDGKLASDHVHAATMKDATPVRTGYTFAGWATTATATTAEYKPGDKINPMTKDVDLYAVWTSGTTATAGTISGTTTTTKKPQTGDNASLILYIVMAELSLMGIAYLCYDQKKAKASK